MTQKFLLTLPFTQSSMANPNSHHQNSFKQYNPLNRNRNHFMSSDSNFLSHTLEAQELNLFTHQNSQNAQIFDHSVQSPCKNPQQDFQRMSSKQQETNSIKTNYSSNKTIENARRRNHALRKQVNDTSLSKMRRRQRTSFLERLNDFRLTQNSSFNIISWEQYKSGQWMATSQQNVPNRQSQILRKQSNIQLEGENIKNRENNINSQQRTQPEQEQSASLHNDQQKSHYSEKQGQQIVENDQVNSQKQQSQTEYFPNESSIVIPQRKVQDFIPQIQMENKLHDDFQPRKFTEFHDQNYSSRYQIYYPRNPNDSRISTRTTVKTLQGFKIISINCGKNLNNIDRKIKKKSYKTKDGQDMRQMIIVILNYMSEGYDFILLQQACDPIFQQHLLSAIIEFNRLKGDIYFFPQHIPKKVRNFRTTTILTKHQVKMGQFDFKFQQFEDYPDYQPRLPTQAFCEFRVKIKQEWENVCIFCCHLKSSKGHKVQLFSLVRKQQIDAIQKFSKNYDRFFCIGDTNIPSTSVFHSENDYVNLKFYDAINYGISEYRGTYLFKNPNKGKVVQERIDRIWLNRESALTTSVLINYHDILLEACEDLDLDQIRMLQKADGVHPYITVTDHTILDIEIMFTR